MPKENKNTTSIRFPPSVLAKIEAIAPEGNVSLWVRIVVEKELKKISLEGSG